MALPAVRDKRAEKDNLETGINFDKLYPNTFKTWIWADVKVPAILLSQTAQY